MKQSCKLGCNWNTGCCELSHDRNIVSFDNLKTKYSINEDIRIEYTLHEDVPRTSTRDWLGIFPRGWTNLQQYLTFEYALVAPRAAASSNRTIIFPRLFHREASTSTEYQFVYVTKEIQVLASSSYFRFTREHKIDTLNPVLHLPNHSLRNFYIEKHETQSGDQFVTSGLGIPHIVSSDQSLSSFRRYNNIIPVINHRNPQSCKTCGRICDRACGLAASRARFPATLHNVSLAERVVRLERDLRLSDSAKLNFAERLKAYEKFVAEMLKSLATKRIVKITDASGKEIVLQQITSLNNISDERITEDLRLIEGCVNENKNLSTNDRKLFGEYLSDDKIIVTQSREEKFQDKEKEFDNCDKDQLLKAKRTYADVGSQTNNFESTAADAGNTIGDCAEARDDKVCTTIEEKSSNCNNNNCEENKETLESNVTDDNNDIKLSDDINKDDNEKINDRSETLQSKPSAIVIQGSNAKFAIIRY